MDHPIDSTRPFTTTVASSSTARSRATAVASRSSSGPAVPEPTSPPRQTVALAFGRSIFSPSRASSALTRGSVPSEALQPPRARAKTTPQHRATRPERQASGVVLAVLLPLIDNLAMAHAFFRSCALFLAVPLITACGGGSDPALRAELQLYLQQESDWAPVEAETARTIDRVLATQFVDEAEVRRQVAADLPRVAAHLVRIQKLRLTAPAMLEIHRRYVAAWQSLSEGYQRIDRGLDAGDVAAISAGRKALQDWRQAILLTAQDLRRLRDEVQP